MALTPCAPCTCIGGNMSTEAFQQKNLIVLCDILTAVQGSGGIGTDVNLNAVGGVAVTLGQKVMASSIPVVISSNQSALSVNPGTATSWGIYAEDTASASGDAGVMVLAKQQATPTNDVGTDGDYQSLKTNIVGAQYIESANQVATYNESITAGAAGGITTVGASVLTNSAKVKIITVFNTTDVNILISPNAGTNYPWPVLSTNGTLVIDLGMNGRWSASNIFAKSIGSNSTSGSLYVGVTI